MLVMALLASLAISSFAGYAKRARAADALEQLDLFHMRMEKAFLDNGNYGVGTCAVPLPTTVQQFPSLHDRADAQVVHGQGHRLSRRCRLHLPDRRQERAHHAGLPRCNGAGHCWMVQRNKCQ
jgi:Tfp pilus assembly protein PilE